MKKNNCLFKFFYSEKITKVTVLLFLMTFFLSTPLFAQEITVTGKVTDATGETLPGVNVAIKGTQRGMFTDVNGFFSLNVPNRDAVLVFSYIGYIPVERTVGDVRQFNIVLQEEAFSIDEVVVVGYGTQKKETLSGAISNIMSEEIMTTKTDNLINNIQGKIPGVLIRQLTGEPGTFQNSMSVRGFGTPTFVIDGVTRNRNGLSDFAQLNPEDIESITVLKDASAAIFGMNANNGVVIVTTKRGTPGKASISYSGLFGLKMPTGMPKMMSAYDYRVMENEFQRNVGAQPRYSQADLDGYREGKEGYPDTDWIDLCMYKVVPTHQHAVNIRGGTEKVRYMTSVSFSTDDGLLKSDVQWYKRVTLRNNLTVDLSKNIKMNFLMSGRFDKRQRATEDFIWTYKSLIVDDRGVGPYTLKNPNHLSRVGPEDKNPVALMDPDLEGYRRNERRIFTSQLDFTYSAPFLKGLEFTVLGAFDYNTEIVGRLDRAHDIYDYKTDVFLQTRGKNSYESEFNLYHNALLRAQANYSENFNGHAISLMFGSEISEDRSDDLMGRRGYDDLFTFDILNQASSSSSANSGAREFRRYAAYFGRLNYNYMGKYLVEGIFRYDGSYRYAPKYRWVLFPSVSLAWRVSEENFFKNNITFVNNLKLRVSYGETGRDNGSAYAYIAAYSQNVSRGYIFDGTNLTVGYYPPGVVKDNMTWRTSTIFDIGADADFLKNKLNVTYDFFRRKTIGILATRQNVTPNFFGASIPDENLDSNMNIGIDFLVKYSDRVGKDFRYSVGANITYARQKNLHIERATESSQFNNWRNNTNDRYTGRSLLYTYNGQFTSLEQYETAPLYGGNRGNSRMLPGSYMLNDNNGDGRLNGDDRLFVNWTYGSGTNPPLQFGFNFDAAYKDFDLSVFFQGAALYSVNYHMNDIWGYGRYPTLHTKFWDRFRTANDTDDPYNPATVWIPGKYPAGRPYNYENTLETAEINVWRPMATYLRMKTLELGYRVPKNVLRKAGVDNLRVFVNGTNLLTFCKKELKLVDPERGENDWDAGLSYPIMKGFNFGLNITF